jgi:hypothetical protein
MSAPDLSSLLLSAIEETAALAEQAASDGIDTWGPEDPAFWWDEGFPMTRSERHLIAMFDPKAVLRRCAADRRVFDRHRRNEVGMCSTCTTSHMLTEPRLEIELRPVPWPCPDAVDLLDRYGLTDHQEGEE